MSPHPPWLLLNYRVPRDPTANRVYVWRTLRKLAALPLQDALWVLPQTPRTQEHFQWLAAEILDMKGEAMLWQASTLMPGQEDLLVRHFTREVEAGYQSILKALQGRRADIARLGRTYQQVAGRDYLGAPAGPRVRAALLRARAGESA